MHPRFKIRTLAQRQLWQCNAIIGCVENGIEVLRIGEFCRLLGVQGVVAHQLCFTLDQAALQAISMLAGGLQHPGHLID
ncbi:hypothetical protein D3C77_249950 [compost metagenome]